MGLDDLPAVALTSEDAGEPKSGLEWLSADARPDGRLRGEPGDTIGPADVEVAVLDPERIRLGEIPLDLRADRRVPDPPLVLARSDEHTVIPDGKAAEHPRFVFGRVRGDEPVENATHGRRRLLAGNHQLTSNMLPVNTTTLRLLVFRR
jgi:hypothetical protein